MTIRIVTSVCRHGRDRYCVRCDLSTPPDADPDDVSRWQAQTDEFAAAFDREEVLRLPGGLLIRRYVP